MRYDLNVETRLGQDSGKTLRKYTIGGEPVIGVWGAEPFAIRVKNYSGQRVEAKVSLDGTDVANGGEADATATGKRWVIDSFGTLVLTAWPESNKGGAAFVFGQEGASVAAHTHGNMNHRGVIAVAIFTEGAPPPAPVYEPGWLGGTVSACSLDSVTRGGGFSYSSNSAGGLEMLRGGPAVGAGSYSEQRIVSAAGLREPRLSEIIYLRYMWWDDLRATLSAQKPANRYAGVLGFPAQRESPFQGISLGSTPRVDTVTRFA